MYSGELKLDASWEPSAFDDIIEMCDMYGLEENKESHVLRNTVEREMCKRAMQEVFTLSKFRDELKRMLF
jgi:hypothetical protein